MLTFKFRIGKYRQMILKPLTGHSIYIYEDLDLILLGGPMTDSERLIYEMGGNTLEDELTDEEAP